MSKSDMWVYCNDSYILNILISGIKNDLINGELEEEQIFVLFRENKNSPNSSIISNHSIRSNIDETIINMSDILNRREPFTFEEIEDMSIDDLVPIPSLTFPHKFYYIYSFSIIDFIKSELCKGVRFFDIDILIDDEKVKLTKDIWIKYILRGHRNTNILIEFFTNIFYNSTETSHRRKLLEENKNLFMRLKFFINDLMKFKIKRLTQISLKYPEYYFSTFYFTEDEIEQFINFPTSSGITFKDLFDEFIKGKIDSTEICTSHDIAPFMYKVFGITKNFDRDPSFVKNYNKFRGI
jgi:hypothetical protein